MTFGAANRLYATGPYRRGNIVGVNLYGIVQSILYLLVKIKLGPDK